MSGDLTSIQCQMASKEFLNTLNSVSTLQSLDTHADLIEQLHNQLKCAIPNGFKDNKAFASIIIDNLYRIVPLLDEILLKNDDSDDFIQTKKFLEALATAFNGICVFDVFIILKNTPGLQTIFKNYIVLLKEAYFTENKNYDDLINCILPIVAFSSVLSPITEDQFPDDLFSYLLTFMKRYSACQDREIVMKNILMFMKVLSKKPVFIPLIIRHQWPHACIEWLIENGSNSSYTNYYYICIILQKLARHSACVQVLNQLNCLQVLYASREYIQKNYLEVQYHCLRFLHMMIYVLLTEADEIKQISVLADNRMVQALDNLVSHTIEASRNEHFFYQCFHISEILSVLCKVFINDDILTKCMDDNNQLFDCLCQLIIHFATMSGDKSQSHQPTDDETLLTLANLLWSISFHSCYHERFQTNSILMHTLSNLATSSSLLTSAETKSIPRDLCSLKKAAEGILWNLKSSSSSPPPIAKISNEQRPLIMISYSHSDAIFCRELVESLSTYIPVWVDYKQAHDAVAHSDDLWEEIARAMEMATVIVLIVSKAYYDSKSCRQELSYAADTLKKRIVPIYAPNQQYRASGWLGIRIAGQKYIHFGRKLFTDAVKELSSMIETDQKPLVISTPPIQSITPSPPEEVDKAFALKDWTTKNIRKWFDDNHIHENLITLYADQFLTGTALIVYARHLKLFYRNEYIRIYAKYYKIFHKKKLDTLDFVAFVDALYRLRKEYDPNGEIEDTYEKCHEQQLKSKIKTLNDGVTWL